MITEIISARHKEFDKVIEDALEQFRKDRNYNSQYEKSYCYGWLEQSYKSLYEDFTELIKELNKKDA